MLPIQWQRHSKRLQEYDYSQQGLYFVTINCKDRQPLFGGLVDDQVILNDFGEIAYKAWNSTPAIRPNISLGAFVIMPDHIHGIICINSYKENDNEIWLGKFISPTQSLGAIVRGYKGTVTRQIKEYVTEYFGREKETTAISMMMSLVELIPKQGSIWQANYYEHIIKNEKEYRKITQYIVNNPENF